MPLIVSISPMVTIELTRQEIWTILCWVGDPGNDEMLQSYNIEEASVIHKLRSALAGEDARLKSKTQTVRKTDSPSQHTDHENHATS